MTPTSLGFDLIDNGQPKISLHQKGDYWIIPFYIFTSVSLGLATFYEFSSLQIHWLFAFYLLFEGIPMMKLWRGPHKIQNLDYPLLSLLLTHKV